MDSFHESRPWDTLVIDLKTIRIILDTFQQGKEAGLTQTQDFLYLSSAHIPCDVSLE
jgi:hypothetical protein